MTGKKITYDLGEIEKLRKQGSFLQALLHHYHLNAEVIRRLLAGSDEGPAGKPQKVKALLKEFSQWYHSNDDLRATLNKGSFKSIKLWMKKMEAFFKDLTVRLPDNVKPLLQETGQVFLLLNIAANKVFGNKQAPARLPHKNIRGKKSVRPVEHARN